LPVDVDRRLQILRAPKNVTPNGANVFCSQNARDYSTADKERWGKCFFHAWGCVFENLIADKNVLSSPYNRFTFASAILFLPARAHMLLLFCNAAE